eukprot:GFKZ01015825.1.p1 GENE.GFKZ01015825.1~~GFKZ01015825.1.p1  ORF type:complete len:897 (+),score=199.75 GFKZ01015825.1:183-2873(+)
MSSTPASHPTTVFVRNLSPQTTNGDLSAHFSSIGPLRRALIVTDEATGLCKGFGFVHFALAEDATAALSKLNGSYLRGRKLSLDLAKPRLRSVKDGDGGLLSSRDKKERGGRKAAGLKGAVGMRTVLVRDTAGGVVEEEVITSRLKQLGALRDVTMLPGRDGMRVMFETWALAGKAASVLHGGGWDACVEALRGGKKTRLIVRNLPFRCSIKEVRGAFEKFAPVRELRLEPARNTKQPQTQKARGKVETMGKKGGGDNGSKEQDDVVDCAGFGFVEYFLVADAKFAMTKMNGAKIGGRVVAVDVSLGKSHYAKQLQTEGEADGQESDGGEDQAEELKAEKGSGDKDTNGPEREDGTEKESVIISDPQEDEAQAKGVSEGKGAESTAEELARTVFVRNLLFETSAPELWTAMANEFGPVEQAVLVKHPVTQRPRGTAFVRFKTVDDADKAVAKGGSGDTSKTRSAVAQPKAQGFMLQGRALLISKAVDRRKARAIDEQARLGGKKVDPRNLRLAWIGQVKAGSSEAKGLSERDLERREKSAQVKRATLAKNPNTFVSDVRLSVKNLPKEFTDVMLKQMFLAVVEGAAKRETEKEGRQDKGEGKSDGKEKAKDAKRTVRITHCKIIRDESRNGRSKGYGFVTFERHEDALAGLHGVNNQDGVLDVMIKTKKKVLKLSEGEERYLRERWGVGRRLDVEFSVEDQRFVRVIEGIKERGRKKAEENRKRRLEEGGTEERRKKRRKNRWKKAEAEETGSDKGGVKAKPVNRADKKGALKRKRAVEQEEARMWAAKGTDGEGMQEKEESGAGNKRRRGANKKSAGESNGAVAVAEEAKARRKKRGRKGGTDGGGKADKLDSLVEAYRRKLAKGSGKADASMSGPSGQSGQPGGGVAELRRWFA